MAHFTNSEASSSFQGVRGADSADTSASDGASLAYTPYQHPSYRTNNTVRDYRASVSAMNARHITDLPSKTNLWSLRSNAFGIGHGSQPPPQLSSPATATYADSSEVPAELEYYGNFDGAGVWHKGVLGESGVAAAANGDAARLQTAAPPHTSFCGFKHTTTTSFPDIAITDSMPSKSRKPTPVFQHTEAVTPTSETKPDRERTVSQDQLEAPIDAQSNVSLDQSSRWTPVVSDHSSASPFNQTIATPTRTVAQLLSHSNFQLSFSSVDEARSFAARRIKLDVSREDDVGDVKEHQEHHVKQIVQAIAQEAFLGPEHQQRYHGTPLTGEEQTDWNRWQSDSGVVLAELPVRLDDAMLMRLVEAKAWMIVE